MQFINCEDRIYRDTKWMKGDREENYHQGLSDLDIAYQAKLIETGLGINDAIVKMTHPHCKDSADWYKDNWQHSMDSMTYWLKSRAMEKITDYLIENQKPLRCNAQGGE